MDIQQIARIAHETNRAYCASIDDYTQLAWGDAPQWQRDSAIKGVTFHLNTLSRGGTPEPATSHESWLAEKAAAGWKYGPAKDPEKKEHPCFVPYDDLPTEQKMKDYLFCSIVEAFYRAGRLERVAA